MKTVQSQAPVLSGCRAPGPSAPLLQAGGAQAPAAPPGELWCPALVVTAALEGGEPGPASPVCLRFLSERCERTALLPGSPGTGEPARLCTSGREAAAAPPSLSTSPRAGGRGGVPTRGVPETSQRGNVLSVARGKGPRGQRPLPGATVQRLVPRTGWGCRGRGAPRCLCGREPRASEATFPISCALRSID